MLFATYQPYDPDVSCRSDFYRVFEDYLGWYPVWCFKAGTLADFLFGSWTAAPTCPERLVFFESDDYVEYDVVEYNRLLGTETLEATALARCFERPGDCREVVIKAIPDERIEMDVHDMMFEFDCEDGLAESNMLLAQDFFWTFCNDVERDGVLVDRRLEAIFKKTAAEMFLGKMAYAMATRGCGTAFDLAPVLLRPDLEPAARLWNSASILRNKIFDEDGLGTEEDYRTMRDQFFACCAQSHSAFVKAADLGRNNPCPCGSGKKLKQCCMSYEQYASKEPDRFLYEIF